MTRTLRDIVAHQQILAASPGTSVRDAARRMAAQHVGAILILDGERLAGIFTERDALNRVLARGLDPDATPLAAVMTPAPRTAAADKSLGHALHMMYEGCFRHVPVVDGDRPIGVVSARDALGRELSDFEAELRRRDDLTELMI